MKILNCNNYSGFARFVVYMAAQIVLWFLVLWELNDRTTSFKSVKSRFFEEVEILKGKSIEQVMRELYAQRGHDNETIDDFIRLHYLERSYVGNRKSLI